MASISEIGKSLKFFVAACLVLFCIAIALLVANLWVVMDERDQPREVLIRVECNIHGR